MYISVGYLYKAMSVLVAGICVIWSIEGCQRVDSKTKVNSLSQEETKLVVMPKDTLLNCIEELVKATSSQNCNLEKVKQIFSRRSQAYKLNIFPAEDYKSPDNETVMIAKSGAPAGKCNITVYLPVVLQQSLLFSDLKDRFGAWQKKSVSGIAVPQPKIPLTRFIVPVKGAGNVQLRVQSRDLPEANKNAIFNINIF